MVTGRELGWLAWARLEEADSSSAPGTLRQGCKQKQVPVVVPLLTGHTQAVPAVTLGLGAAHTPPFMKPS